MNSMNYSAVPERTLYNMKLDLYTLMRHSWQALEVMRMVCLYTVLCRIQMRMHSLDTKAHYHQRQQRGGE